MAVTKLALPPIGGAVLISNPRKEPMGLAFTNPIRGRINMLARKIAKGELPSPRAAVAAYMADKQGAQWKRVRGADGKIVTFARGSGAKNKGLAKLKRAVAKEFAAQGGPKYGKSRGRKGRMRSFQTRVLSSKASQRRSPTHKMKNARGQIVLNVAGIRRDNEIRIGMRKESSNNRANWKASEKSKSWLAFIGDKSSKKKGRKSKSARRATQKARRPASPKQLAALAAGRMKSGIGMSKRDKFWAAQNPGSALLPMGSIAFTNPGSTLDSVRGTVTGFFVPGLIIAAGAAGATFAANKFGLTDMIASSAIEYLPESAGSFLADRALYTTQASVVAVPLLLASTKAGAYRPHVATLATAMFVCGAFLDGYNYLMSDDSGEDPSLVATDELLDGASSEGLSGLALTNPVSALGGIALTNPVSALGDGFSYELAPLTAAQPVGVDFGQACLADAAHCAADFDQHEGNAILNGSGAFVRMFGHPSRRAQVSSGGPSHLAGQRGFQWGWLINAIGWQRAAILAALPPKKRVALIAKMRRAAIQAFQQERQAWQAQQAANRAAVQTPAAPAAGVAPSASTGAMGATSEAFQFARTNYMGEPALFAGRN